MVGKRILRKYEYGNMFACAPQDRLEAPPKARSPACSWREAQFQPAVAPRQRKRAPFDAQPTRSKKHESACGNQAVPLPRHHARRATSTMLYSTFLGKKLLLRSQRRTSPVQNIRKSRITLMVLAGLLVLVLIWAALVALRHLPERQLVVGLQHPVMTWLDLAIFSFNNINASNSAADVAFSAVASGVVGRRQAFFAFVLRESKNTMI
ncbi:hypothetical protein MRX96_037379 [Rhipicephalus microplus]